MRHRIAQNAGDLRDLRLGARFVPASTVVDRRADSLV
jgi:hypothetical protein